jgi:hypothetical protein
MYLLNHRALVDDGHARLESDGPKPFLGADIQPWLRKVISRRSWIARWSSWLFGTAIHVSPVSGTWLRAFEDDWNKRGADI